MAFRPYRRDYAAELAAIDARRLELKVRGEELARRAGMDPATYWRMKKSGRAFPQKIRALRLALRSLAREAERRQGQFPLGQWRV